jgi:transcriptional regulator with XRE-family HTH domain
MPDPGREIRIRVGRAIRRHRITRGFSQERLAELTGSSGKHVGAIERGEANVGLDVLGRLASALSIDVAQLFARPRDRRRADGSVHLITREEIETIDAIVQRVKAVRPRRAARATGD